MCKMVRQEQPPLANLIALFPPLPDGEFYGELYQRAVDAAMLVVRDAAGGCPACILAARKLAGVPLGIGEFSFKYECEQVWATINEEARLAEMHG